MEIQNTHIHLRGIDESLIEEWRKAFSDCPKCHVEEGDIFKRSAEAIVSPANSFGYMDGGLDLKLREFFGVGIELTLKEKIKALPEGELLVGNALVLETNNGQFLYMISAPTMRCPGTDVSNTINAYLAMKAILCARKPDGSVFRSIAVPGLASSIGRMPPEIVARQMRAAYDYIVDGKYRFENWDKERAFQTYLKGKTNTPPAL